MARFSRYDNMFDNNGRRRTLEELNRLEEEFKQQQILKLKKNDKINRSRNHWAISNGIPF